MNRPDSFTTKDRYGDTIEVLGPITGDRFVIGIVHGDDDPGRAVDLSRDQINALIVYVLGGPSS